MSSSIEYSVGNEKKGGNEGFNIFDFVLRFATLLTTVFNGCIVGLVIAFGFRNGLPLDATSMHAPLCAVGYQLCIGQAILSLSPFNGWLSNLKLVHKKRVHWVMQIIGGSLAITGSIIKIRDKTNHWETPHGKAALVALIFVCMSFINGLVSLWSYELSRISLIRILVFPLKLGHICFGSVAFVASSTTICYGMDKPFFRSFITDNIALTCISFVIIYTIIIILSPLANIYKKIKSASD